MVNPATRPFMYCDPPSAVVAIRRPVDATHAGAGHITLVDGASFAVSTDDASFVAHVRAADPVTICYAPAQAFADAGPGARMAIAGDSRTRDYVFSLAYAAAGATPTHAVSARPATSYTMLVPTTFDGIAVAKPGNGVFVRTKRGRERYRVEIDLAPRCDGANVCSVGAFSGYGPGAVRNRHVTDAPDGDLSTLPGARAGELPVTLVDGTTAYYARTTSGAGGGGNSSLRFLRDGTLYLITSRPASAVTLVATANSAIRNALRQHPSAK